MKIPSSLLALALLAAACEDTTGPDDEGGMSFFVSSTGSATGNLSGLAAADARCQSLAAAVGGGSRTWRAYLSVERDAANGNNPTHARDRIGTGPWFNAAGGLVAQDLAALHARRGDAAVFLDERGQRVPGQWAGSPSPNQHDILTGSDADGRLMAGTTCGDWTSSSPALAAQVGHSDGLGPGGNPDGNLGSWNSSHASQSCADTAPRGGAGRIYCFAAN
jgi:hypothetical protein